MANACQLFKMISNSYLQQFLSLSSQYLLKEISIAIHARDNPISFEELHDKFFNYEAYFKQELPPFDATSIIANFANKINSSNKGKIHNQ